MAVLYEDLFAARVYLFICYFRMSVVALAVILNVLSRQAIETPIWVLALSFYFLLVRWQCGICSVDVTFCHGACCIPMMKTTVCAIGMSSAQAVQG